MARRGAHRRKLGAAAALALAAPLALAACGGGSASGSGTSSDSKTLRVLDYYQDDPGHTVWHNALVKCGTAAGVKIQQTSVPGANLITKVLQQGQSKTLPDLLMLDNPDLQQIAATGALAPLDQFGISTDGYAAGVVKASTYKGKLYGLQPVTNSIALFYNKDILAAAGVQPPTTWDELKAAAKKLTANGKYGLAMSMVNNYEGTWQFLPFMWSNGGDEKNIATPQTAAALQLLVDMYKDGSISKSAVNWTQADANDQFKAGNAAMMINGPWQYPVLDATQGLNYAVVPTPAPTAGGKVVSPLGGETWTVPETGDAAKQKKAAAVVKCLNSDENQKFLAEKNQTVPTKTAVAEQYGATNPKVKPFVDLVPDLRARTGELGEKWPDAATKIYTAEQDALVGGMSPMDALKKAQNG
jgi:multiple sugar transport system substrate-binding protein